MNNLINHLNNHTHLIKRITEHLQNASYDEFMIPEKHSSINTADTANTANAVLFLLSGKNIPDTNQSEACLVLTKRSYVVKQPGDLCCPGGGISPKLDSIIAKLITLPGFPLFRWPYLSLLRKNHPENFQKLKLLLSTGLREGFEEMRLNPFKVKFLGILPPQQLIMFRRKIYPMVCWSDQQKQFTINREVEKMIHIPVRDLLKPENYACYRLIFNMAKGGKHVPGTEDYMCYVYNDGKEKEKLWGATFRITLNFLYIVFGFKPPDLDSLPVIEGALNSDYLSGNSS